MLGLWEAWTLEGQNRLHLSVREKRESNAQSAPQDQVETKRSPKDSSGIKRRKKWLAYIFGFRHAENTRGNGF